MGDVRSLFGLLLLLAAGGLLYLLAPVLTPFLVAGLLAYVCNPLVARLVRWHLPRAAAVVLVFVCFVLVVVSLLIFLIPALQFQVSSFMEKLPGYLDWVQHTALPQLEALLGIDLALDLPAMRQAAIDHFRELGNWAGVFFAYFAQSGLSLLRWFANLLLIPVVTFYLLLDWNEITQRALMLLPPSLYPQTRRLAHETDEVLGSFLRGQLLVMLALAVIYSAGLTFIGLDLALPIGLLAGFASFVPYLGFIIGILSAGTAAYLQFHDTTILLWVSTVFLVGQLLEGMWLTPRLVGSRIGLHPVAVIFAVMAGGQLFGFMGVLLALPGAAVLKVWARHAHASYVHSRGQVRKKRRAVSRPSA